MPLYTFESDGQFQDIFYLMKDVPSVGSQIVDEHGVIWRRVFTCPNTAISTVTDPYSTRDFNKSLDGKNVTVGDMWDASKEASDKRAAREGVDPVRAKYLSDYKASRKGQEHSVEKAERFARVQNDLGIAIKLASR